MLVGLFLSQDFTEEVFSRRENRVRHCSFERLTSWGGLTGM
jgi:hypothetical protein